jgi:hypothetical protein
VLAVAHCPTRHFLLFLSVLLQHEHAIMTPLHKLTPLLLPLPLLLPQAYSKLKDWPAALEATHKAVALHLQEFTALQEERRKDPRKALLPPNLEQLLVTLETRAELLQKVHHYAPAIKVGGRRWLAGQQVSSGSAPCASGTALSQQHIT